MDTEFKTAHDHPFPGNSLMRVDRMDDYEDETRTEVDNPADANVVSSIYRLGPDIELHRPVLDIDFPAALVPSTTPGHFHLYLNVPMRWEQYEKLLRVLAEVGIIEDGYANVSIDRRHTAVRVPWIRKGDNSAGRLLGYAATLRNTLTRLALSVFR